MERIEIGTMTDEQLLIYFYQVWHQLKATDQNIAFDILSDEIESGEAG